MRVNIEFGALSPDLVDQLAPQGLTLENPERYQRAADGISYLYVHGFLTPAEVDRARRRLSNEVVQMLRPINQET